jgi:hypothetical protein
MIRIDNLFIENFPNRYVRKLDRFINMILISNKNYFLVLSEINALFLNFSIFHYY